MVFFHLFYHLSSENRQVKKVITQAEIFEVSFMFGLKVRDLFASANITTGNFALNFIGI